MMTPTPQTEPLYVFAVWMLGSRDAALTHLRAALNEADPQTSALKASRVEIQPHSAAHCSTILCG